MGKATRTRASGAARRDALIDTAITAGLPEAQRDRDRLAFADTLIEDGHRRSSSQTVRRLTRVEMLARAGVLEPHEVQACEWYAEITAVAWDAPISTAAYDRVGGRAGGAFAPDYLMARTEAIAAARADYGEARAMLGSVMAAAFEAVICRNEALGPTAAAAFPMLGRSQAG